LIEEDLCGVKLEFEADLFIAGCKEQRTQGSEDIQTMMVRALTQSLRSLSCDGEPPESVRLPAETVQAGSMRRRICKTALVNYALLVNNLYLLKVADSKVAVQILCLPKVFNSCSVVTHIRIDQAHVEENL
jgi:hypothetical protein